MILPDDDMEARIKRLSADVDKALADCVASSTDGDVVVSYILVIVADDRAGALKADLLEGVADLADSQHDALMAHIESTPLNLMDGQHLVGSAIGTGHLRVTPDGGTAIELHPLLETALNEALGEEPEPSRWRRLWRELLWWVGR